MLPANVHIADGEARVFGNKLYVYGSEDISADTYCSTEYRVVSTDDMLNWNVHKRSFSGQDIPWVHEKTKKQPVYHYVDFDMRHPTKFFWGMLKEMHNLFRLLPKFMRPQKLNIDKYISQKDILFAPDCVRKGDHYYLYFCTSDYSEGVAVSDTPEGPFIDPKRLPCGGIDPSVFIDDDGSAYYFWGQFRAWGVPLNEDMVSFDPSKIKKNILTEEEHGFHEGSSVRKRNGIYYYVYPCLNRGGRPTCLAYATAEHPLGPYRYRGIIIDNAKCDPESWNIHGSIQEFNGQWYVFYHRSSGRSRALRRLCVEKIYFNEDGEIDEVKSTSIGAGEPFRIGEKIEGWRACEVAGGAYIDNTDLVFPEGGSAVFRYVMLDGNKQCKIICDKEGPGKISFWADGIPLEEITNRGIYECRIEVNGALRLQSFRII